MNATQGAETFFRQGGLFLVQPWVSPLVMIIGVIIGLATIFIMWALTQKQIKELRKIEEDKRFIAVESLIYELEQNKNWVNQFIHDCNAGGHKGKIDRNIFLFSWVWNSPQLIAYENYLNVVCGNDKELAIKIINLYSRLESCKIIVHFIHELLINNAEGRIIEYNDRLEKICLEIQNYFDEPIEKLKSLAQHVENKVDLDDIVCTTSTYAPISIVKTKEDKKIEIKPPSEKK